MITGNSSQAKEVEKLIPYTSGKQHYYQLHVVFDASATKKKQTGVSPNDTLMIGPIIYPPLICILLQFCYSKIAITADISNMYGAVELSPEDRSSSFHLESRSQPRHSSIQDNRMKRIRFRVAESPFAAT